MGLLTAWILKTYEVLYRHCTGVSHKHFSFLHSLPQKQKRMSNFDDKELKSLQQKLNEGVANLRNMSREEREKLKNAMDAVVQFLPQLIALQNSGEATPEETAYYLSVKEQLAELVPVIENLQIILAEANYQSALKIMEALKTEADKGNAEAKVAYEKLYAEWKKTVHPSDKQLN